MRSILCSSSFLVSVLCVGVFIWSGIMPLDGPAETRALWLSLAVTSAGMGLFLQAAAQGILTEIGILALGVGVIMTALSASALFL